MARGATLAAHWLHEHHSISNQPVGFGFPHPARRYRPAGSPFSSRGCWGCRDMEGFLIWGWEHILPGCGGTSALARGATLAARWLHEPQPISNHPVGLGFPHRAGRYRPGRSLFSCFRPWVGVVDAWREFPSTSTSRRTRGGSAFIPGWDKS